MAMAWKKMKSLGVFAAILLVVATEASVVVYNPANLPVSVLVDGQRINVESAVMSMNISQAEQRINVTTPAGSSSMVDVRDGDVLVLLPEPLAGITPSVRVVPIASLVGSAAAIPPADPTTPVP